MNPPEKNENRGQPKVSFQKSLRLVGLLSRLPVSEAKPAKNVRALKQRSVEPSLGPSCGGHHDRPHQRDWRQRMSLTKLAVVTATLMVSASSLARETVLPNDLLDNDVTYLMPGNIAQQCLDSTLPADGPLVRVDNLQVNGIGYVIVVDRSSEVATQVDPISSAQADHSE
jgi:hypothetical protein